MERESFSEAIRATLNQCLSSHVVVTRQFLCYAPWTGCLATRCVTARKYLSSGVSLLGKILFVFEARELLKGQQPTTAEAKLSHCPCDSGTLLDVSLLCMLGVLVCLPLWYSRCNKSQQGPDVGIPCMCTLLLCSSFIYCNSS